jgi:hypothetical protein
MIFVRIFKATLILTNCRIPKFKVRVVLELYISREDLLYNLVSLKISVMIHAANF